MISCPAFTVFNNMTRGTQRGQTLLCQTNQSLGDVDHKVSHSFQFLDKVKVVNACGVVI